MRIPKSIEIKGEIWEVKYKWNLRYMNSSCDGLCDFENKTIFLCRGMDDETKEITFFHELYHALIYSIKPHYIHEEKEEKIVDELSHFMVEHFKIRPKPMLK